MSLNQTRTAVATLTLAGTLTALLLAAPVALAAGGAYTVDQCDAVSGLNPEHAGVSYSGGVNWTHSGVCTDQASDYAMTIHNAGPTGKDQGATWTWYAPPNEAIIAASFDASLRNDAGVHAHVFFENSSGVGTGNVAVGDANGGWRSYGSGYGSGQARLVMELFCSQPSCGATTIAHAEIRKVRIALADYGDPTLQNLGGGLLAGGWVRGTQAVTAEGLDGESGVASVAVSANGQAVASAPGTCQTVGSFAGEFDPCSSPVSESGQAVTTSSPFHDGENAVQVCAVDFAANRACQPYTVKVDNTAPTVTFASPQDPRDPERIVAPVSDSTSGVARGTIYLRAQGSRGDWQPLSTELKDGSLIARVNSEGYKPGPYEFMASATDAAGNDVSSTMRSDGTPMTLTFPLKAATKIQAHFSPGASRRVRLGYRADAAVSGRLALANGKPLKNGRVKVVENFAPGSIVAHRRFTVRTNRSGAFRAKLPHGPSRGIEVAFLASPRYQGASAKVGRLLVKSKASFATSRKRVSAGKRVTFHGAVAHYGARIPSAGKLVELQVKQGAHEWNTVQQAIHTNSAGRYHLHYRFGTFYRSNVRYRFRVKIDHEADWPYRAPVRSRARSVTVIAK